MTFGKKLYELRKQKGLSQEELADKANVSRQTLSKWELGESVPDMEKLVLLSDYFQVSLDELVLGKEDEVQVSSGEQGFKEGLKKAIFAEPNKKKLRKGLKIAGIILAAIVAIDIISLIVYFLLYGFPK